MVRCPLALSQGEQVTAQLRRMLDTCATSKGSLTRLCRPAPTGAPSNFPHAEASGEKLPASAAARCSNLPKTRLIRPPQGPMHFRASCDEHGGCPRMRAAYAPGQNRRGKGWRLETPPLSPPPRAAGHSGGIPAPGVQQGQFHPDPRTALDLSRPPAVCGAPQKSSVSLLQNLVDLSPFDPGSRLSLVFCFGVPSGDF